MIDDAAVEADETLSVTGADAALATYAAAALTITDDDTAGVIVTPTALTVTEAAGDGHAATYAVALTSEPT